MSHGVEYLRAHGAAVPFPDAARWAGFVITGGHIAEMNPPSSEFRVQAEQAMSALSLTLERAGTSLRRILRLECFLSDLAHFEDWNAVYRTIFGEDGPPRTTLIVDFVIPAMLIEVQAIAATDS
jgi:enamine deaminase RidA (YjgF/YER057c/UK114 family)